MILDYENDWFSCTLPWHSRSNRRDGKIEHFSRPREQVSNTCSEPALAEAATGGLSHGQAQGPFCVRNVRHAAEAKRVELRLALDGEAGFVSGDATHLQ